jgi:hypothetical protein
MKVITAEVQNIRTSLTIEYSEGVLISRSELVDQLGQRRQAQ